jgi:oxygen-dependent protoporphyrinogen oxidase
VRDSVLDAVVVGAGIAGLAAACELRRRGLEVAVYEAGSRAGGVAQTERRDGYLFERGPNTFRVGAPLRELLAAGRLEAKLVRASPASRERFLLGDAGLVAVPLGPLAFARTPLLSTRAKLRLLREPFVPRASLPDESAAAFVARRLGPEVAERLVAPFLIGIYAGDARRLAAQSVFAGLADHERRHGSIARGLLAGAFRRGDRALAGIFSARGGVSELMESLAEELGPALRLGTPAVAVSRSTEGWEVETPAEMLPARGVVLATPAREAAGLLRKVDDESARLLEGVAYAPVASVSFAVDPAGSRERIRGFGFLVPPGRGDTLLGCLFMSRLFPGRAPDGRELLTCLCGGTFHPELLELADDRLVDRVREGVVRILGLRGEVRVLGVTRWPRAVPQPVAGHRARVAALRARLAARPGLALAGAYLDGVAFGDAAASGFAAAGELAVRTAGAARSL